MKIRLFILLVVCIVATASSAFAAPVADVPQGHWAYKAVEYLAKAGIVDGYGDGTFRGDKTMTRYEMSEIVAKAMNNTAKATAAQKALIDKLSIEFAMELNHLADKVQTLDDRVTKLEKKTGTVAFTGDGRIRLVKYTANSYTDTQQGMRLHFTSQLNDETTYAGSFFVMRHTKFGTNTNDVDQIYESNLTTNRIFGLDKVSATYGRYNETLGATGYWATISGLDGVRFQYDGDKCKVTVGYANFRNSLTQFNTGAPPAYGDFNDAFYAKAIFPIDNNLTTQVYYLHNTTGANLMDAYGFGFNAQLNNELRLRGDYVNNTAPKLNPADGTKAEVIRLHYKGGDYRKPGTWGMAVAWKNFEKGATLGWNDFFAGSVTTTNMIRNYELYVDWAVAKNLLFQAVQTFNSKYVDGSPYPSGESIRAVLNFYF